MSKSALEQLNEFVKKETEKRQLSKEFQDLSEKTYEEIVRPKAKINSLEIAKDALIFSDLKVDEIDDRLNALKVEVKEKTDELESKVKSLIKEENKEDFIKIAKDTKFRLRDQISFNVFKEFGETQKNFVREFTNETILLAAPYEIAELIINESQDPSVERFIDLYKPSNSESEIDTWINRFKDTDDDIVIQQVRDHYNEVITDSNTLLTHQMIDEMADRWLVSLNFVFPKSKEEEDKIKLLKEAREIVTKLMKKHVAVF